MWKSAQPACTRRTACGLEFNASLRNASPAVSRLATEIQRLYAAGPEGSRRPGWISLLGWKGRRTCSRR